MIGAKAFYPLNGALTLNKWVVRDKFEDIDCIPLKNAISPATTNIRVSKWHKDAIAYMLCDSNAVSHGQQRTAIFSSAFGGGHGFYITAANIVKASIIFSVRMSTTHTWLNHQDQFYTPSSAPSLDFENDCLIYMLFSGKNLSASAELDWNGKKWQVVNHFIPFTEIDVGSKNSFRSNFMSSFLAGRGVISQEASDVMNEGKKIYTLYFTKTFDADITKKLHLNEPDVGWYQIRKALVDDDFTAFNNAYKKLEDKIYQAAVLFGFIR